MRPRRTPFAHGCTAACHWQSAQKGGRRLFRGLSACFCNQMMEAERTAEVRKGVCSTPRPSICSPSILVFGLLPFTANAHFPVRTGIDDFGGDC